MTGDEFKNLLPGDIVLLKKTGEGYVVTASNKERVFIVRSMEVFDPNQIDLFDREKIWKLETKVKPKKKAKRMIRPE